MLKPRTVRKRAAELAVGRAVSRQTERAIRESFEFNIILKSSPFLPLLWSFAIQTSQM